MPRGKKVVRDQQVYKLAAYGAIVTIDYDAANPPPFFQPGPGIVIVGDHVCAQQPMVLHDPTAYGEPAFAGQREFEVPRGGNFAVDVNSPAYRALRNGGIGQGPAPPGVSPEVLTSEQVMGVPAGSINLQDFVGVGAPAEPGEN